MALAHVRAQGRHIGGIPFGFAIADDGKLVPVEPEQGVIQRIISLRSAGATLQAIANSLNDDAIPTRHGKLWQPRTVKYVIDRAA